MRKKTGFNLRNVCGEHIVVAEGKENIDFSNIISMNESSAFVWNALKGEFTVERMAELLAGEYEVSMDVAKADCAKLAQLWMEAGIIECD